MSFFQLPTESSPQDTGISSVRVNEVSPISSINPSGGGTVAFELTSLANSYLVPRMSYWNFRLRITKSAAQNPILAEESITNDYNASTEAGGVQFRSNPIASIVNTIGHQINSVSVETVSNIAECSSILLRTYLSHEFLRSSGGSMHRLVGADGKRNSTKVPPMGSLQPWNGGTTVFDCAFTTPSEFSSMPGGLPGGRHRWVLTLNSGLRERVLQMGSTRAGLSAGNYVNVTIESITFMATHMIPDQMTPIPRNVVLSLHSLTVVMSQVPASTGNTTHTLSVPPSTYRIFVCMNLQSAGSSCEIQNNHDSFEPGISSLQVSYAGLTLPQSQYTSTDANSAERQLLKPYADYLAASGRLYYETSSYDSMIDYMLRPIFGFSFEKAKNDTSTNVQVRLTRAPVVFGESLIAGLNAANLIVAAQSHVAVVLTYGSVCLISIFYSVVALYSTAHIIPFHIFASLLIPPSGKIPPWMFFYFNLFWNLLFR